MYTLNPVDPEGVSDEIMSFMTVAEVIIGQAGCSDLATIWVVAAEFRGRKWVQGRSIQG